MKRAISKAFWVLGSFETYSKRDLSVLNRLAVQRQGPDLYEKFITHVFTHIWPKFIFAHIFMNLTHI